MPSATLDRIAETTSTDAAGQVADIVQQVIELLPWSASLPAQDFTEMMTELRQAALASRRTGVLSDIERAVADWQATAEAYRDRDFLEQLARRDKTFVVWK